MNGKGRGGRFAHGGQQTALGDLGAWRSGHRRGRDEGGGPRKRSIGTCRCRAAPRTFRRELAPGGGAEAILTKVQLSSADGRAWRVLIQQADKDSHHSGEEKRVFFLLHLLKQTWVLRCLGASRFSQAEGSNLPSGPL